MLKRATLVRAHKLLYTSKCTCFRRSISTAELKNGIKLAYEIHEPPSPNAGKSLSTLRSDAAPIIFIHGLFGSRRNNRTMSKVFARDLKRPVYAIDCRNHGDSSHDPRHDYNALAEDIELFMDHFRMRGTTLVGHSMGAKTAMAVALRQRVQVASLIPVDNAPVDAALKSDFTGYTQAMRKIEDAAVEKQSEADRILSEYESEIGIRQFLLTNLVTREDGKKGFRIPMKILANSLSHLGDFPFKDPDVVRYEGPTLMVRGTKSHYVADEMLPVIGRFFPKFQLADIDAGHWVISEKPEEFRKAVVEFLQDKD